MTHALLLAATLMFQEPVQIRVTTRLVEVGVLVHDRGGRPVTGLRADDFRLLDGGRPETIRIFSVGGRGTEAAAPEARVSTAILLDHLNTAFGSAAYGRGQLLRFLREMEPNQPVALLALDGGFEVLHDFTTDSASLVRALERHRPYRPIFSAAFRPSPVAARGPDGTTINSARAMMGVDAVAAGHYEGLRGKMTASAAAALSRYLSRTPGRKNLIWISSVFPGGLAAMVRKDDVAIYPVDLTPPDDGPRLSARLLAERTGGMAFNHGNSALKGIRDAYRDSGTVYLLGYYPSHEQWNGQFRTIQVGVNRPRVEVRHRRGYVAALDGAYKPPEQWESLAYVALAPAEIRGIGIAGRAMRLRDGTAELRVTLDAQASGKFREPGAGLVEVLVVPVRWDGSIMDGEFRKTGVEAQEGRVTLQRLAVPADASKLRVVVKDVRSGALGSATLPLNRARL